MRFWLTSLAILAELLVITTAASHRGHGDSLKLIQVAANEAGNEVCETQECYDTASRLKNSMNFEVNPCDDFYEYTCGRFTKTEVITNKKRTNNFDIADDQLNLQLASLLGADIENGDIRPIKLVKTLYKTCTNEEAIEAKEVLPLKQFTQRFGGWPVVEGPSWNESNFDWMATPAEWTRAGLLPNCFLNIRMAEDSDDKSQRVIRLEKPFFLESYIFDEGRNATGIMEAYYNLMVDVAVSLGADRKRAETELKEAILFHIELITVINAAKNETKLRMPLKELIECFPSVNWSDIFARAYSPMQTIADSDIIVVKNPYYIDEMIKTMSRKPKRLQANFAMFQIIQRVIKNVNRATRKKWENYQNVYGDDSDNTPRFVECVNLIKGRLAAPVAAMYMKKVFTPEKKAYAKYILREIKQQFRASLDKVSFVDSETRTFAKEKYSAIKKIIGYPEGVLDDDNLNNYYRDLAFSDNDYFTNQLLLKKFMFEKTIGELTKRLDKIDPASIRKVLDSTVPYNEYASNTIVLPANAFQGNIFNLERPDYINFGVMGWMLGHEITHIFSGPGNGYDANGAEKKWWTTATERAYNESALCFVDQYGSYVIDNTNDNVNGLKTLEENVADNGGVKTAYYAYVNSMRGKTPEKRLPGLDKSPNQIFWIAAANIFCEEFNAESWMSSSQFRNHPPYRNRVIGTLSNSEEFANDFSCPPGSKMNPVKKCSVW